MATSKVLKPRRGSTTEHASFKGQAFEITFDTDKKTIVAHDGLTMGGFPLAHEAAVAETDEALRALIEEKVSEVEGVSSSELRALESALRGLINANAQQQATRDADQDNVIDALNSTLRALIAQEVAKYLPLSGGGPMTGAIISEQGDLGALQGASPSGQLRVCGGPGDGTVGSYSDWHGVSSPEYPGGWELVSVHPNGDGTGAALRGYRNEEVGLHVLEWKGFFVAVTLNGEKANGAGDLSDATVTNTHTIFTNGFQVAMGYTQSVGTSGKAITFPVAFKTANSTRVMALPSGSTGIACAANSITTTGCKLYATATTNVMWIVIGLKA